MILVPAVVGSLNKELTFVDTLFGSGIWPLTEELVFRGFAFHQLYRHAHLGLWKSAITVGVVFGMLHLGNASVQNLDPMGEIGVVLITGLGGILFAWLFARWNQNLWAPFSMHMLMNLTWSVFSMGDTALGGWLPNVLRLLTVLLAIALTLKHAKKV
jgi:membrane protease YdiL (CAAX protease family)